MPAPRRRSTALPWALVLALALGGCSGPPEAVPATPLDTETVIRIAVHPRVGHEASAAVVATLLQRELGYEVERQEMLDTDAWHGLQTGAVDVIIENWGHEAEKKEFIEQKKVALSAGLTGNTGGAGWYVPAWMAEKYPDITDWRNLNKYANLFRTAESGERGQLLNAERSDATNDEALVDNLKLDYEVVYAGSEAAVIKAAREATERRRALLMYFYEPQWLFAEIDLVKINLPPYAIGCDAERDKVACDYPPYLMDKIVSARFAQTGGRAYELVRNFQWTNEDQNAVAGDIASGGMNADQAAQKWIAANRLVWQEWIPR